jgi:hypothetical protein
MSAWFSNAPAKFGVATSAALVLTTALTCLLAWHWLRRALDVPRVPRPRAMYGTLVVLWAALAASSVAALVAGLLLRDHRRLAGPTDLAVLRCQQTAAGRLRMEVLPLGSRQAGAAEQYDLEGNACDASIIEIELRQSLRALGMPALARLDAVGPFSRPRINPAWLTPASGRPANLTGVVVLQSRVMHIVVPTDPTRRFILTAAPGQNPSLREDQKS